MQKKTRQEVRSKRRADDDQPPLRLTSTCCMKQTGTDDVESASCVSGAGGSDCSSHGGEGRDDEVRATGSDVGEARGDRGPLEPSLSDMIISRARERFADADKRKDRRWAWQKKVREGASRAPKREVEPSYDAPEAGGARGPSSGQLLT